jgi:hypothetical protein
MDYEGAVATFFTTPPEGTTFPAVVANGGPARRLRDALEPLAMHAIWARPVYDALARYGLDFFSGYVYGRGAALGDVPSALVTSTFAVFPPAMIDQLWRRARAKVGRDKLIATRDAATAASLRIVLGDVVSDTEALQAAEALEVAIDVADGTGRPLFSALRAGPKLTDPFGRLWRAADLVREHRGGSHIAACVAAGLGPCEMNILTELWLGYPMGEYSNTRGWPRQHVEASIAKLTVAEFVTDWKITDQGRRFRTTIEERTDAGQRSLVEALGDELVPLAKQVALWSDRCIRAGTFPADPRKRAAG